MNAEAAAHIWHQAKRHFLSMRKGWSEAEEMGDPAIDGLVEYTCKVLADLAERADDPSRRSGFFVCYLLFIGGVAHTERFAAWYKIDNGETGHD